MKKRIFIFIISAVIFNSCRNSSVRSGEFLISENEKHEQEAISDISRNITSPVEIANLLQRMEVPFSNEYLASSINANRQNTNFDKALKLGILGADLGYLNMYEMTGSSLDVLYSIRKLAEDIKVGQFFNFELIKRLSQEKSDLDSLLFVSIVSIDSYTQIDSYLRNNDRGQLSSLIVIGVWIEAQYLATQVLKQYPDKILRDRIGEQKIILENLQLLVAPYCKRDSQFEKLCNDLKKIKDIYSEIIITYTSGEPLNIENEAGLTVIQTETSNVEMSDEQLESITEAIKTIRKRLIANN
jgi:hypothetical protein